MHGATGCCNTILWTFNISFNCYLLCWLPQKSRIYNVANKIKKLTFDYIVCGEHYRRRPTCHILSMPGVAAWKMGPVLLLPLPIVLSRTWNVLVAWFVLMPFYRHHWWYLYDFKIDFSWLSSFHKLFLFLSSWLREPYVRFFGSHCCSFLFFAQDCSSM
jgi:hypothetical protein